MLHVGGMRLSDGRKRRRRQGSAKANGFGGSFAVRFVLGFSLRTHVEECASTTAAVIIPLKTH